MMKANKLKRVKRGLRRKFPRREIKPWGKNSWLSDELDDFRERLEGLDPSSLKRFLFRSWMLLHWGEADTYRCPCCNDEMPEYDWDPGLPVTFSHQSHFLDCNLGFRESWTETWTCPCCGTVFEIDNGT